jgi:hypothetical protein
MHASRDPSVSKRSVGVHSPSSGAHLLSRSTVVFESPTAVCAISVCAIAGGAAPNSAIAQIATSNAGAAIGLPRLREGSQMLLLLELERQPLHWILET